jgi:prophage DNA circulation protein
MEKPERDRVREKVWAKIDTVDEVIKQTYNSLEEFQREIKTADSIQDKHIEELKAMLQELAASQHGTDEEMQQIKMQIGTLRSDIADLRSHLDNGYSKKLVNDMTIELLGLVKLMSSNKHELESAELKSESETKMTEAEIKKIKMQKRFEFWTKLLTTGGILFFLVTEIIRYILH